MIKNGCTWIIFLAFSIFSFEAIAQKDSLILINGNTIVGEIKKLDKGVFEIETPYSDSDFKIKWSGLKEVYSQSRFMFTLKDGTRITGQLSTTEDGKLSVIDSEGVAVVVNSDDVVGAKGVDEGFLSRLYANIDVGYSLAKTNNQEQFNGNFRLGYLAEYWELAGYYNSLLSRQTNVASIMRNDFGASYRYYLPYDWYLMADLGFLNNTEQSLDLRSNVRVGAGNYVIHTNQSYLGFAAGVAHNRENFGLSSSIDQSDSAYTRNSWESFIVGELNLFNIGDLSLYTNITAYPSLTESGRVRADFRFDAKYEDFLLKDFYIRAGFTANYDNKPAAVGKELDYVFTTGFGWSW